MVRKKKVLTKAEAIKLLKLARTIIECIPYNEDNLPSKYYSKANKFMQQTKNL